MTMMGWLHTFWKDCRGAAAAEMALIIPLLVVMMLGPMEIAYYFWTEHKVVKGVRDGARFASRLPFSNFTCGAALANGTLETQIKNVTRTGRISGGSPNVTGWENADVTVTISCASGTLDGSAGSTATTGIYRGLPNAPIVTVSTNIPHNPLFTLAGFSGPVLSIKAYSQSAVMGI